MTTHRAHHRHGLPHLFLRIWAPIPVLRRLGGRRIRRLRSKSPPTYHRNPNPNANFQTLPINICNGACFPLWGGGQLGITRNTAWLVDMYFSAQMNPEFWPRVLVCAEVASVGCHVFGRGELGARLLGCCLPVYPYDHAGICIFRRIIHRITQTRCSRYRSVTIDLLSRSWMREHAQTILDHDDWTLTCPNESCCACACIYRLINL